MAFKITRTGVWAFFAISFIFSLRRLLLLAHPFYPQARPNSPPMIIAESSLGTHSENTGNTHRHSDTPSTSDSTVLSPTEAYFDQAFSLTAPQAYAFPALRKQCAHTKWLRNDVNSTTGPVYLRCEGIYLGLTTVMSQVKSCFKMAIEAGAGVILPDIPLRAADNLLVYNQGNHDAERPFGAWFDEAHVITAMQGACPGLNIITPRDIEAGSVTVVNDWSMDIHAARFFRERDGYFWAGKPFSAFFEQNLLRLRAEHEAEEHKQPEGSDAKGDDQGHDVPELMRRTPTETATVIGMRADFELFSATQDPTGHERLLWDELGRTLRFLAEPRAIVDKMLRQLAGNDDTKPPVFFAVHFRGEGDNMWAEPAEQIRVDLDALDAAWEMCRHDTGVMRGQEGAGKPPVYLACGDEEALAAFATAGAARGWNVTSKYALAKSMETSETLNMIEELPFDFQAIIDLGLSVKSYFFIGIMGSAFSYTTANLRDPTTRYRGSSLEVWDDDGARTHLFPNNDRDGNPSMEKYACCL